MPSVIYAERRRLAYLLSVIMLSVIMLNVVAPFYAIVSHFHRLGQTH
jgi:hypothetical protein